ncbi:GFA family protein [Frateuria soli]|uniref:GFA family protein n=1 Tax=Frateuria soli TaxID=1542730 RepID=UPI001E2F6E99|nr:GFA family protein [Frateuria soli]UGB38633.1 GFA family protein [Frateuria soli]
MRYHGSCHCGRVAFDVEGELEQAIDCNCSHCSRKGYLLWFVPRERLELATQEADMATYTFNKHAIQHRFCPRCGCAPLALGTAPDGQPMAAINVRCLEDLDLATVKRVPVDGRSF